MITLPTWAFAIICVFAGFSVIGIIYLLIDFILYCIGEKDND